MLLEIQLSKRGGPINWFNPTTFLCLSQDFQHHKSWYFFVFSDLRQEVVVRFVDIGGIVDHHRLHFLFIMTCFFQVTDFIIVKEDRYFSTYNLSNHKQQT